MFSSLYKCCAEKRVDVGILLPKDDWMVLLKPNGKEDMRENTRG
jgi:hypothetical protein